MKIINKVNLITIAFFLVGLLTNCNKKRNENAVARVYDKYLDLDEIKGLIPNNIHGKDSLLFVKSYIDSWIQKNIVLRKAENNLNDVEKDIELQIEDYRVSLITYLYEKELVNQKLDTAVSLEEITTYYNKNSTNFELKDNIIKVWYIKLKKNVPELNKFKTAYKNNTEKNKIILQDLCSRYAENFYLKEDSWLLFDDLLKEIPIKTYDKEDYLENNRLIEISDKEYIYLINIIDFKVKSSVSPLTFETQNIKNIILNKRKLQLIENMKKELRIEAEINKEIEVY